MSLVKATKVTRMSKMNLLGYAFTGLVMSGSIFTYIVKDQEKCRQSTALNKAHDRIQQLEQEVYRINEEKDTIGIIGSIGVGLAVIAPVIIETLGRR